MINNGTPIDVAATIKAGDVMRSIGSISEGVNRREYKINIVPMIACFTYPPTAHMSSISVKTINVVPLYCEFSIIPFLAL